MKPNIFICGLLAFSSGFSVLFIMCTIPIWLNDFGISKTVIGWFSIVYLPYVLKILWAPIMEALSVPFFGKFLGHLRGWAFTTQLLIITFILCLCLVNPTEHLLLSALLVTLIAFFSASRDIALDAYRVEILKSSEIAPGSAMYLLGYRLGMLVASAGSLFLADYLDWRYVFFCLACCLLLGLLTILLVSEPQSGSANNMSNELSTSTWLRHVSTQLKSATEGAFKEFTLRKYWFLIVLLIPLYKLGDNFVQSMSNIFFLEIGFSKSDIASTVKIFGLLASITGSIWGGIIVNRLGDKQAMLINGIIHIISFWVFVLLSVMGNSILMLYFTIAITHVTGGIVTTAFVSFISNLCHRSFKVTQYAFFSSLRSLDKCLTFPAGWLADQLNWTLYFMIVPFFGLPALFILAFMLFYTKSESTLSAPARKVQSNV